jgi:hypothetical protein
VKPDDRDAGPHPPQLTPLQAWILGLIDTATLRDLASGMDDRGGDILRDHGRALIDPGYAEMLLAEAQHALEQPTPQEQAYAMYEALTDRFDEAVLDSQEAEGQPVGDVREQRRRELEELRPPLGLGERTDEHEAER